MFKYFLPFVFAFLLIKQATAQTTFTVQPDATTGIDAWVVSETTPNNDTAVNFGTSALLDADRWTNTGVPYSTRGYLKFDVSSIPTSAVVCSAVLTLHTDANNNQAGSSQPNTAYLKRATSAWTQSLVTWNRQPTLSTTDTILFGPITTSATAGTSYTINVTSHIQDMITNPSTNYGWAIMLKNESSTYAALGIASSNYTVNASYRPMLTVTYVPSLTVAATATNICSGHSSTLTASGATSYSWTPSTSLSASTGSVVVATPTTGTTYTITGTTGSCQTKTSITVGVNPTPTISIAYNPSSSICIGQTVTLTASGAPTYSWSTGATTSTLVVTPTVTTTYSISGTQTFFIPPNCTGTNTSTITVNSLPTLSVSPSATICSGSSTTFTVGGANTYSWTPSTGLSTTTGTNVSASPTVTTTYTVTGTSAAGCVSTKTVTATVNAVPSLTTNLNGWYCTGTSYSLTASGASTYTWSPSAGLSTTTGSLVVFTPTASGSGYSLTVTGTGANTCSASTVYTYSVFTTPTPSVNSGIICIGNSITLSAGSASVYTWTPSTGLSSTTDGTVTANPMVTTVYTVTETNAFRGPTCSSSATSTVTVNATPTVNSATICSGNSAILTTTVSPASTYTYSWAPSTGLSSTTTASVTATPTSTTVYTVTITSSASCTTTLTSTVTVNATPTVSVNSPAICIGSSGALTTTVSPVSTYTYSWSPSSTLSSSSTASVTATPTTTTVYTVTVSSSAGCIGTKTSTVTVNTLPTLTVSSSPTVCVGTATTLTVSGANTYSWSPGTGLSTTTGTTTSATPTVTTTYTVTGTNTVTSCVNTKTVTVNANALPTLTVSSSPTVCAGTATTLTVSGANTYSWSPGTGLSTTTGTTTSATPTVTTTYIVTGTNTVTSCVNTKTVTVNVNALPTLSISPSSPAICLGSSTTFTASGANTYTWIPNTALSCTVCANPVANPITTTTYTITGTNTVTGCINTQTVTVNVNPVPIGFAGENITICSVASTILGASITGATSYSWTPTTGLSNPSILNPIASPTTTTIYTLTASNSFGCTITVNDTVTVALFNQVISMVGFDTIYSPDTLFYSITGQGISATGIAMGTQSVCATLPDSGYGVITTSFFGAGLGMDTLNIIYNIDSTGAISDARLSQDGGLFPLESNMFSITGKTIIIGTIVLPGVQPPYYLLKKQLDGGFYVLTGKNKKLRFKYEEKYNSGILNYRIMDKTRSTVSLGSTLTRIPNTNLYSINIPFTQPAGYYYLEVTTAKGEVLYLRFKI